MLHIKHSIFADVYQFFQTIYYKRWLDKNRHYYDLLVPIKFWRYNYALLAEEISTLLQGYKFINSLKSDYYIYLSPLGVYGNYRLPNVVHVNVQRESKEIAKTLIHEMIHLMVEADVIKLKLTHAEKESLVESKFKEMVE